MKCSQIILFHFLIFLKVIIKHIFSFFLINGIHSATVWNSKPVIVLSRTTHAGFETRSEVTNHLLSSQKLQ